MRGDQARSNAMQVTPVARESSGIGGKQKKADVEAMFPKAECRFTDVTDTSAISKDVFDTPKDVVVCCLASRTGGIKDSWDIDYQVCSPFLSVRMLLTEFSTFRFISQMELLL
jgi:hypothetical protein